MTLVSFYNVAVNDPIFYWGELLSPLQGLLAPTWQIPICLTLVSLPVLLVSDEELEADGCALADIADIINEITLSAIAVIKKSGEKITILAFPLSAVLLELALFLVWVC